MEEVGMETEQEDGGKAVIKLPESSMKETGKMFARLGIFYKGIHDLVERGLKDQKEKE